jgi:hypothetical protein
MSDLKNGVYFLVKKQLSKKPSKKNWVLSILSICGGDWTAYYMFE